MRHLLVALAALVVMAVSAVPVQTVGWSAVAERVQKSIVFVETKNGRCTGFVVHSDRRSKDGEPVDLVLTAAHCDGPELLADQRPATVVNKNEKKDLLVLEVEDTERPFLQVAKSDPKQGDEVVSYGFGYGLDRPMLRRSMISDDKTYIPEGGIGGPLMATDISFVPGMSGGPVVNEKGEVVMMVQMGTSMVGFGVGAETIRDKVGRYLEKPKVP
jgi:S1-C subfamily serine protease